MSSARVTGPGVGEMKILAAKLHGADADLKKNLRKQMREAAKPIVAKVQRSILDMPAEHYPDRGLREEVARTVYSSVSLTKNQVQVTIISSGRRMPDGKRKLPEHLNDPLGWSHPVFPHGPRFTLGPSRAFKHRFLPEPFRPLVKQGAWTWVRQIGKPHWFDRPITESAGDVRQACADAIGETLRRLG